MEARYAQGNMAEGAQAAGRDPDALDLGCTIVASIDEDAEQGQEGAREIAGMYPANKVQNLQASADTLLECAKLDPDEIRPIADAMERGGRLATAEAVTDEILDKCRPIAGTPRDCIEAIEEYRDAGCTHVMLELWDERRDRQIELFRTEVLPHFR
jgi:5,10-methylenetetrahydromethanopterin reductase